MGIGMLSMPYAMRLGGWAGLAALASALALFAASAHALIAALELLPAGAPKTYPALGAAAFGPRGAKLVAVAALSEFGGGAVCTLAFAFAQAALFVPHAQLSTIAPAVLAVTLPLLAVGSFKRLTPLSALGNVSSVDPRRKAFSTNGHATPGHHAAGWSLIRSLGIFAVSVSGHSSLPALRASMADPSLFPAVLNTSFAAMAALYGGVAVAGYYYYGDGAQQVVTASLARDSPFSRDFKVGFASVSLDDAVGAAILLNAVTTYPALVMIVQETLWAVANPWSGAGARAPPRRLRPAPRLALRLAVAAVSAGVSIGAYASIANALALLGGSSSMVASLLLPLAAYMRMASSRGVLSSGKRAGLIALLAAGVVVTVAVVWQAAGDLLADLLRKKG
jgi:solute carrier family 32 (vesicular inhibitory amino acid transporter)